MKKIRYGFLGIVSILLALCFAVPVMASSEDDHWLVITEPEAPRQIEAEILEYYILDEDGTEETNWERHVFAVSGEYLEVKGYYKDKYGDAGIEYKGEYILLVEPDSQSEIYSLVGVFYYSGDPQDFSDSLTDPEVTYIAGSGDTSFETWFKTHPSSNLPTFKEGKPELPPLDDASHWDIHVDSSNCTFANAVNGEVKPKVTIRANDGTELVEGTDFELEIQEDSQIGSNNKVIIKHIATSEKCGAPSKDIVRRYTVSYAAIADYYTLENVPDEIYSATFAALPGLRSSQERGMTESSLRQQGVAYLKEKGEMGSLPQIGDGTNAELWNGLFLDIKYTANGKEYSSQSECWRDWMENPTETVTVTVAPKSSTNPDYYNDRLSHSEVLKKRLTGSLSKTVRIRPYSLSETKAPAYPPTERYEQRAQFVRTNPQITGTAIEKTVSENPISPAVYTGKEINPDFTIGLYEYSRNDLGGIEPHYTTWELIKATTLDDPQMKAIIDSVSYEDNVNAGTGKIKISFKFPYTGSVTRKFTIDPKNIADAAVTVSVENPLYTGQEVLPKLTVTNTETGAVLKEGTDYTVAGGRAELGAGTAVITGIGNYKGTRPAAYQVNSSALSDEAVYEVKTENVIYNGKAQLPKVTVLEKTTGKVLVQNTDYRLEAAPDADNVSAGKGHIKVVGITMSGSVEREFVIEPKLLDDTIEIVPEQAIYNGAAQLPVVKVTDSTLGQALQESVDFFVSAETGADNINVGTGKAILTGIGNYTGTKAFAFTIAEAAVPGASESEGMISSDPFVITNRDKSSVRLLWGKQKGSDGYQVYMATRKGGKYKRVAQTNGKRRATIKKLKTGTTYYFKVRSFKTVKGKKVYQSFSKPMAICTRLDTPKFTSVRSAKKRTVSVKWKRDKKADGYQVFVKKGKGDYKLAKEIRSNKKISCSVTKLSSRSKVTVRMRSYKIAGGKRYYSSYTSGVQVRVR